MPSKRSRSVRSGGANLLLVLFISILATLIIASIQSRLLLQIQRSRAKSDILVAEYHAQSQVYDLLARMSYPNFSLPAGKTQLPAFTDGTILTIENGGNAIHQKIIVTAVRPFAVSKIELTRIVDYTTSHVSQKLAIVLALDCTSSLDATDTSTRRTRWVEEREAVKTFIKNIDPNVALGITLFRVNTDWLVARSGIQVRPDLNLNHQDILAIIDDQLNHTLTGDNPQCISKNLYGLSVFGGTSVGSPYANANRYFKNTPFPSDTKKIIITITDGATNSRQTDSQCQPSVECQTYDMGTKHSCGSLDIPFNYLICAVATSDNPQAKTVLGYQPLRDPTIDAYGITVLSTNTDPPAEIQKTKDILNTYATRHYTTTDAAQISTFLNDSILSEITTSKTSIQIRPI